MFDTRELPLERPLATTKRMIRRCHLLGVKGDYLLVLDSVWRHTVEHNRQFVVGIFVVSKTIDEYFKKLLRLSGILVVCSLRFFALPLSFLKILSFLIDKCHSCCILK